MKFITLYVGEPDLKKLKALVDLKFYPNRSEAIRLAIHDLLSLHRAVLLKEGGELSD